MNSYIIFSSPPLLLSHCSSPPSLTSSHFPTIDASQNTATQKRFHIEISHSFLFTSVREESPPTDFEHFDARGIFTWAVVLLTLESNTLQSFDAVDCVQ